MASVTRCALDRETATATADERNRGVYGLRYLVDADGFMSPRLAAEQALVTGPHALPSLWSSYSYLGDTDAYSFARSYNVQRDQLRKTGTRFTIDVTYSPLGPGERTGFETVNPVLRPPVLDWDSEIHTELVERDILGQQIVNKIQRRYDDPIEREATRGVIVITFNVANFAAVVTHNRTFELATNSTNWDVFGDGSLVIGQREAFCRSVRSQRVQTELSTKYYTETYRIALKKPGQKWDRGIAEQALNYWKKDTQGNYLKDSAGNNKLFPVEGDDDFQAQEPFRLKDDGTKLPDNQPGVFTDWRIENEANFNSMPFMPIDAATV